ncbi:MAG: hypothetical protein ABL997_18850, partial [Planctomycetota bacterium]
MLHGSAAEGTVEFGAAFRLDVVRRWPVAARPEPWTSTVLAPLVVIEEDVATEVRGDENIETRRCSAFVFQRGAVTLLPESKTPRTLLIDSCLPDGDSGTLELPPMPTFEVVAARRVLARGAAIAAIVFLVAWGVALSLRSRRRRVHVPPPRVRLAAEVQNLCANAPTTDAQRRSEAVAATRILREAAQQTGALSHSEDAAEVDRLLDDVKFAGRSLSPSERQRVLALL